jgi:hypothetical protein
MKKTVKKNTKKILDFSDLKLTNLKSITGGSGIEAATENGGGGGPIDPTIIRRDRPR